METLRLRTWSENDLELLHAANTPEMTAHLNGPETDDQIMERHARYLRLVASGEARMFVVDDEEGMSLGSIGYWPVEWRDEPAWETGWFVRPEAQGARGRIESPRPPDRRRPCAPRAAAPPDGLSRDRELRLKRSLPA
ncbi:GNAT family N-acetyltransferase [Microbacterium oxydans]|nr:GNAT family N-acetyltransferase [Microbacterium oxydans]